MIAEQARQAVKDSLMIERDAIQDILAYLDLEAISRAVEALAGAPRIATCASGSSGFAAMKFAHSLCCIELPAKFLSPAEAVHGGLGYLKKGDAVLMVSRGGKTVELLPVIEVCMKKKVTLIGVTENLSSKLAASSDIVLPLRIRQESDRLNVMATASFIATVAIFDALLAALIDHTGYTLDQFALIHPGGAVGAQLAKG